MNNRGLYIIILILAVVAALSIGFIAGYYSHQRQIGSMFADLPGPIRGTENFEPSPGWIESNGLESIANPRIDVLFPDPDNESIWKERREEIPAGDGIIEGGIMVDDQPGNSLEVAFIVSPGRITQKAMTDRQGKFRISIPRGKYFLNAVTILGGKRKLEGKVLANTISLDDRSCDVTGGKSQEELEKEFAELVAQVGPEEAARKMKNDFSSSSSREFAMNVSATPFEISTFYYRDPISVLAPKNGSVIKKGKVKFIWDPVPAAKFYFVDISKITRNGTITSYHGFLREKDIKQNMFEPDSSNWQPGAYGYSIMAVDSEGRFLSSSQVDGFHSSIEFTVE